MPQENLILDYAPPPLTAKFPTTVRVIVLLFILPALALPFAEYIWSISPLEAAERFFRLLKRGGKEDFLWLYMHGLFFFTGIPLVLCHLRLLIFGELSKIEAWLGYIMAALGMAPVVAVMGWFASHIVFSSYDSFRSIRDALPAIVAFAGAVGVIAFGICLVWLLGRRISPGTRVCACLCIPYTTGLLWCAVLFGWDGPKGLYLGYWLSLPVIVGGLIELTTLAVMAFRRRVG
ncbi:MAG: hypothetical protein FWD53_03620 [Phycisphaerales bacterium]|nr:hypothetical protein [Phycisphaerales bacterium]